MSAVPFALRRPWLLVRDFFVDRDRPDLERLHALKDPERFLWAILPHAARTFSSCIALLPASSAKAAAVAYLYCRILDTYEDLVPDPQARDEALERFVARLDAAPGARDLEPAPGIAGSAARDERDRSHLLLVNRCHLVDRVFLSLSTDVRPLIVDLVRDMGEGMRWSSRVFEEQSGVLRDEAQITRYCRNVLGNPVAFTLRLLALHRTGDPDLGPELHEDCMRSGEMIQLANVTRDIEKDLARGIAYRPELAGDLGAVPGDPEPGDPALAERVRGARRALLLMALERVGAYRSVIASMDSPRLSVGRASAVLMLLYTDRYYRSCARRVGLEPWGPRPSGVRLILASIPAVWSRAWAYRRYDKVESDFRIAAESARN